MPHREEPWLLHVIHLFIFQFLFLESVSTTRRSLIRAMVFSGSGEGGALCCVVVVLVAKIRKFVGVCH